MKPGSIIAFVAGGIVVAIVVIGLIGWALWAAIPEPDTRHSSVSPSGERTLYLFESCTGDACSHQAILELPSVEGPTARVRCGLDIEARSPLFFEVEMIWSDDENVVEIGYMDEHGESGAYRLDFEQACMGD